MCDKKGINISNFRKLIDKTTREKVAKALGCDTSLVTKHYNGDRSITLGFAIRYADYFNVSLDYLVGKTDTPTTDKDIRFICDYTGLTDTSISTLHKNTEVSEDGGRDVFNIEMLKFTNKFISEYAMLLSELAYMYKMNFSSSVWYKQKYLNAETPEENEKFGREACNKELLCEINALKFQKVANTLLEKDSYFEEANEEVEKKLADDPAFALARLFTQTIGGNYGND